MPQLSTKSHRIDIRTVEGCEQVEYTQVFSPAFIDHAGEPRVVQASVFYRLSDLVEFLTTNSGKLYVLECLVCPPNMVGGDEGYVLRCASKPEQIPDIVEVGDVATTINARTFDVELVARVAVKMDRLLDLVATWGRDEAVRQIGETMLRELELHSRAINMIGHGSTTTPSGG